MAAPANDTGLFTFLRWLIEHFSRLDSIESNIEKLHVTGAKTMAQLSDFTDILAKLTADVAAVKAKSDLADIVKAENEALKAQIEDLKKQVADAKANGGMTADEEATVLAQIAALEAQTHVEPAPVVVEPTPETPTA